MTADATTSTHEVTWSEHESKQLLAQHGVMVAAERLVQSSEDAARAATTIGFPVVAKLCGRAIAHKTERGLVKLRLGDSTAVDGAAQELLAAAQPDDGDVGVLVAEMVSGNRELIVGVATDPQFGLTIMVGIGGIFTEVLADVAFRLLPITPVDAHEMIDDLDSQALLGPFRGEPEVDRQALAETLLAVGAAAASVEGLTSIDVNPLIVVDGKPVAVDALVVTL